MQHYLPHRSFNMSLTVGILSLQGGFHEHLSLLRQAVDYPNAKAKNTKFKFIEVRTSEELSLCDALIIPGGESTTIAHVAAQTDLLEKLREFVKSVFKQDRCPNIILTLNRIQKKPTWGTCAGLILLSAQANSNSTKVGGQELIGGLSVRIHRNHFGRQIESFEAPLILPFLPEGSSPFPGVFIRAPVVEEVLAESEVEILAKLPGRVDRMKKGISQAVSKDEAGDIIAVRQGNILGTSFHPELTGDSRVHAWFLNEILLNRS